MKTKILVILMSVSILLSACGGTENTKPETLEGTSWELVYYRKSTVMDDVLITVSFDDDQINGSAGCNSYFGSYEIVGDKISIGQIGITEMFCMDPEGVMDLEMMFVDWLMDAQRFEISSDQLMIFRTDGEALTFVPKK